MAAPAVGRRFTFNFRDAKGQMGHVRVLIGGANEGATMASSDALQALLQATSNAFVTKNTDASRNYTLGAAAVYQDVVDKAVLTFKDPLGGLHRYQVPAPLAAGFLTDGETVNTAETNMAALIAGFASYVYGSVTDTSPLAIIGGIRVRRRMIRKFNIFTLNPAETGPGE